MVDFARPALGTKVMSISRHQSCSACCARLRHGDAKKRPIGRSTFGTTFRYAVATGRATRDISHDLRGALITPKPNHRAAIVDPKQVGALLRAIEQYDGLAVVRLALRLLPHVFVRPGELRLANGVVSSILKRGCGPFQPSVPRCAGRTTFPCPSNLSRSSPSCETCKTRCAPFSQCPEL